MKEHKKTILETGVKSDVAFCLGPSIEKTNSVLHIMLSKKGSTSIFEMETIERKRNIRPAVFTYFLTHLQIYTRAQKKSNVIFEANIFARLNASTLA